MFPIKYMTSPFFTYCFVFPLAFVIDLGCLVIILGAPLIYILRFLRSMMLMVSSKMPHSFLPKVKVIEKPFTSWYPLVINVMLSAIDLLHHYLSLTFPR